MRVESTPVTGPVAVYVLTTEGPVRLERLSRESGAASSMVCLQRSSRKFDSLSTAYEDFVRAPTGVIDRDYPAAGSGAYRLDISAEITDGDSWQFGVFVAHALHANGCLCGPDRTPEVALMLTGSVDVDLRVGDVAHVREKLHAANGDIELLTEVGIDVRVILPVSDAAGQNNDSPENVVVERVGSAAELVTALGFSAPGLSADLAAAASGTSERAEAANGDHNSVRKSRRTGLAVGGIVVAGVVVAGALLMPNRIDEPSTTERVVIPTTSPASEPESAQVELRIPRPKPVSPPAAAGKNMSGVRDSSAAPADSPAVTVSILERRAPDGATCANVLFGTAEAALSNVRKGSTAEFAVSQGRGLCGLSFVLTPDGVGGRAQATIEIESGRLIEQGRRPSVWLEGAELTAPVRWDVDLPQRRTAALNYRIRIKMTHVGEGGETNEIVSIYRHRIDP